MKIETITINNGLMAIVINEDVAKELKRQEKEAKKREREAIKALEKERGKKYGT